MFKRSKDISGKEFGTLTAVSINSVRAGNAYWDCICSCGNKVTKRLSHLSTIVDCGWSHNSKAPIKDNANYVTWKQMRQRCNNPNHPRYADWGGRGISVCDRWEDFKLFDADMGPKPTSTHSIDRIDNDGDYTPNNCRWATPEQQSVNQRVWKISSTKISGVRLTKNGKYLADLRWQGKYHYLGVFEDFFDACCARKSLEVSVYG